MKAVATKDVLKKLDRIEQLLLANLLGEGQVSAADLKSLGISAQELKAARKAAVDFDIAKYVHGSQVKQWK